MIEILGDKVIYEFTSKLEGKYEIDPNSEILVHTNDCFFQQIDDESQVIEELDYSRLNPATGPIYVRGAERGDLLKVEVLDIEVASKGAAAIVPGEGVLGDKVSKAIIRIFDVKDGFVDIFGENIKIEPMIGVIGVATAEEDGSWTTDTPWKHGGNMDTKEIKAGSTLYFPVNQEGGLLALGDCHAIMGDGEICFTGLEIPAKVKLKVDLIKDRKIEWPIVERENEFMILASGEDLDDAIYKGTDEMVKYLMELKDISFEEAFMMASLLVDIRISQVVDPKKTIRAVVSKDIVSIDKLVNK